jgi:hypothetical protein
MSGDVFILLCLLIVACGTGYCAGLMHGYKIAERHLS